MLDLVLPRRCVCCGAAGHGLCPACTLSLPAAPDLAPPPGYMGCWSLLRYDGTTRDVVGALKYGRHRDAVQVLGQAMARLLDRHVDMVTWAPTSRARRRRRGFDQAEVLARAVASDLGRPCRAMLERTTTAAQTGLDRSDRLCGPGFRRLARADGRILVVDDVRTTGATLVAAADALAERSSTELLGLTLAVRP